MILKDDRTEEQKKTHRFIVAAIDRFMSGWGKAKGGLSYCGWACREKDVEKVMKWVSSRKEMKRVRVISGKWKPQGIGHTHIYVVEDGHTALI